LTALVVSARQPRAAASVANDLRIFLPSRTLKTAASKVGLHEQRRPSCVAHVRLWRERMPVCLLIGLVLPQRNLGLNEKLHQTARRLIDAGLDGLSPGLEQSPVCVAHQLLELAVERLDARVVEAET
jgi:hypothetical protein